MNPVIQIIQSHGIPTRSPVAAIHWLGEESRLSDREYRSRIKEMSGHDSQMEDKFVRHHYLYLVQETIRRSMSTDVLDMDEMFELSTKLADKYVKSNPWVFAEGDTDAPPKLDAAGNPKQKKGAKKEKAIALYQKMVDENNGKFPSRQDAIKRFVEEVGMTPAGASTYVANCKTNFGKAW